MSITDELREYAQSWRETPNLMDELDAGDIDGLLGDFEHIADRIDAEHERLMRERRGCIHYDQERHYCNVHDLTTEDYKRGYDDGFASADDWLGQHESDMAEHGWIRLPKDANGEYIHVGDRMEWVRYKDGDPTIVRIVSGIGNGVFFAWSDEQGRYAQYKADAYRHYHAPTVEDVLREMLDAWGELSSNATNEAIVAEYAAKLRLAESEDA